MFDYEIERLPLRTAVIRVSGTLNETTREYFFGCIRDLIRDGIENIVVDCEALGKITSSGLASLLQARNKAQRQRGRIRLSNVNATIAEMLNVTRLNRIFALEPSTNHALKRIFREHVERLAA